MVDEEGNQKEVGGSSGAGEKALEEKASELEASEEE